MLGATGFLALPLPQTRPCGTLASLGPQCGLGLRGLTWVALVAACFAVHAVVAAGMEAPSRGAPGPPCTAASTGTQAPGRRRAQALCGWPHWPKPLGPLPAPQAGLALTWFPGVCQIMLENWSSSCC